MRDNFFNARVSIVGILELLRKLGINSVKPRMLYYSQRDQMCERVFSAIILKEQL